MTLITCTLLYLRDSQSRQLSSPQAQADWQEWRERARKDSEGDGPVHRSVPSSHDPPLLVLMTDHFTVLLFFSLLFGSVLFFIAYFFVRGTIAHGKIELRSEQD
jgi:hypothetical protein